MTEIERVKPRNLYVEEAIQAALESRWNDAVTINRSLLDKHGPDEDTYNRLGKALSELGDLEGALGAYVATLGDAARDRLERHLREAYLTGRPDGDRSFVAVALSCRGVVSKD